MLPATGSVASSSHPSPPRGRGLWISGPASLLAHASALALAAALWTGDPDVARPGPILSVRLAPAPSTPAPTAAGSIADPGEPATLPPSPRDASPVEQPAPAESATAGATAATAPARKAFPPATAPRPAADPVATPATPASTVEAQPHPGEQPSPAAPEGVAAGADSSAADATRIEADYLDAVRAAVQRHRYYPSRARRLGLQGTVGLRFVIGGDGGLVAAEIAEASGSRLLDSAAIDILDRVGGFEPLPRELGRDRLVVHLPVDYRLH